MSEPEMQPAQIMDRVATASSRMRDELAKAIIGQEDVIEQIIIALFARGHCLMTGVPGLGKTLLVKSIAQIFSLSFKRIQFTPDLMPADICGTEVIDEDPTTGKRTFSFNHGPVFANIVLADEINRTPPKTQAALLEAMEERQVTAAGHTYPLEKPFFVLATQNPIELEGTYPLPEAQLDRFLLNVVLSYLPRQQEEEMVLRTTNPAVPELDKLFSAAEIQEIQQFVRQVPAPNNVIRYAVSLVSATRLLPESPEFIRSYIKWGAGSRASQALILGGKVRALLHNRPNVSCEDVRALAKPVLRHRIMTNFHANAEGITNDAVIDRLLDTVPEPTA